MPAQKPVTSPASGPRSALRLSTRLTLARSDKLAGIWVPRKQRCQQTARNLRMHCKASRSGEAAGLRRVGLNIRVLEGDTLESLSARYGISKAKLEAANGGEPNITPGQTLQTVMKVPDDLMPTQTEHGIKLVPVEAAYSDDEQEAALAHQHKQLQEMEAHVSLPAAAPAASTPHPLLGTARYFGGSIGSIGKLSLVLLAASQAWSLVRKFDKGVKAGMKTRLEDPDVRAEMEQRHGRSFLDHLDSEDAEHEAEDVRQQQESQAVAAAAAGARRAAEQSIHLQRRHVADAIAQPSTSESLPVAAVSSDASQMLVNSQQQQTPLQLRHRDNHEDPAHAQSNAPSSTRTGLGQSDTRNGPEGTSHSHLHPQDDSTDTSASAAEDASADSAAAAHMITAAGPAVAPTAPSQDGLSSSLPPDHDESSAQASVPSAIPSASAASATAAAAAAEDAAASSASVDSAELDDDLTESELSWVDSDMVYLATDEEGHPFNCHIPADPESGRPELQCLLLFEAEQDLAQMLYKTAAFVPVDMGGEAEHPLALLANCVEDDRMIAMVPKGAAMDVQHVIDPTEWMQQLTASAQILSIDSMASILLSRLDKLQEAEERARQSSLTHAAANSAADAHARAGDGSTADSEPASSAHGATAGRLSHDRGTPSQNGSTSSIAHTSHAEAPNSHGSAHSADASGTLQQGSKPAGERGNAYAAMKKKEVVHLSKESLNELNQSIDLSQNEAASASQSSLHASPHAVSSQNGEQYQRERSSQSNKGQPDQGSKSLTGVAAFSSIHGGGSSNGSLAESHNGSQSQSHDDSWRHLSHVCVPVIMFRDGGMGYVTADMADGAASEKHMSILAFESRADAEEAQYLVQANLNAHEAMVHVAPMPPEELQKSADQNGYQVTVYGPGDLQLKPGMTFEQIRQAAVVCR